MTEKPMTQSDIREEELTAAMTWLQGRRRHASSQADVWHLRYHWATEAPVLLNLLATGRYRLSPMQVVGSRKKKNQWSPRDALVLKWVTQRLSALLPVHPRCEHVRGHGGDRVSACKRWIIWAMLGLGLATQCTPALGAWTSHGPIVLDATKTCQIIPLLSYSGGVQPLYNPWAPSGTVAGAIIGVFYIGFWAGTGIKEPFYGQSAADGTGSLLAATPPLASVHGCPGSRPGLLSSDGHAALVATSQTLTLEAKNAVWPDVTRMTMDPATDSWSFSGWVPNDGGFGGIFWPALANVDFSVPGISPIDHQPIHTAWIRGTSSVQIGIIWDGTPPSAPLDLPAGTFGQSPATPADNSPAVAVSFQLPAPTCAAVLDGKNAPGATRVNLDAIDLPPACSGTNGGCSRINFPALGQTTVQVQCSVPAEASTPAGLKPVTPRLTFQGLTDDAGAFLLKTSQTGVYIWGGTTGQNGCDLWGQTAPYTAWGTVDFTGRDWLTTDAPWSSTATGWTGNVWQTAVSTLHWGVCVDTMGGRRAVSAGPFTAAATWTLHLD